MPPGEGSCQLPSPAVPTVPMKDLWSLILYSDQTSSMIQTDQRFPCPGGDLGVDIRTFRVRRLPKIADNTASSGCVCNSSRLCMACGNQCRNRT